MPEEQFTERRAMAEQVLDIQREIREISVKICDLQSLLKQHITQVHGAFLKNEDDGSPDFRGHRDEHKAAAEKKKTITGYQAKATERVVMAFIGSIAALIGIAISGTGDFLLKAVKAALNG